MTIYREYRNKDDTPLEAERRTRGECLNCGKPQEEFDGRHRGHRAGPPSKGAREFPAFIKTPYDPEAWRGGHFCCCSTCTDEYWSKKHPTVEGMRRLVRDEQGGKCAACKRPIEIWGTDTAFILDHILPIAMGGAQWDRANLQCLCARCNKEKTARDMGRIATWKRVNLRGVALQGDPTRQVTLLEVV